MLGGYQIHNPLYFWRREKARLLHSRKVAATARAKTLAASALSRVSSSTNFDDSSTPQSSDDPSPLRAFCVALPKCELHAHIGGCVRARTLLKLLDTGGLVEEAAAARALLSAPLTLASAFAYFKCVHAAVRTAAALSLVVREAVADAAIDGVVCLELRSTPRALAAAPDDGLVRALPLPPAAAEDDTELHRYVAVIGAALVDAAIMYPGVTVRLLLSFDRAAPPAAHAAVARVAAAWADVRVTGLAPMPEEPNVLVVGVDVSGDPRVGDARELLPLLSSLRARGIKVAFHTGEIRNDDEYAAVSAWRPDRYGHMAVLSDDAVAAHCALGANAPPIEVCPTSNALTLGLGHLRDHPTLRQWLAARVPVAICSDDPAAFRSPLSAEFERVAVDFGLGEAELEALALRAFDYSFVNKEEVAVELLELRTYGRTSPPPASDAF